MKPRDRGSVFAGRDKLVHLIGLGEVVQRLGRGFTDRLDRTGQIGQGFPDGNQPVALTLHALFSHVPQTRQGQVMAVPLTACPVTAGLLETLPRPTKKRRLLDLFQV